MQFSNLRWTSATQDEISAVVDGRQVTFGASPENRFFAELTAQGLSILPFAASSTPHLVSRLTILQRLQAENKFAEALAALKSNDVLYEEWQAVPAIYASNAQARALFVSVGVDPDLILAPEEGGES